MAEPVALMTFSPDAEERAVLDDVFAGVARIVLLPDGDGAARRQALQEATVIVSRNIKGELRDDELPLLANVKLMQTISAGFNHLPFASLPATMPIACNAGGFAEPMAEHVVAMVMAAAKRLAVYHQQMTDGVWTWGVKNKKITGALCGILGFGGIGQETARMLRGLGMKIWATNRSGKTDKPVDFIGTPAETDKVLRSADVVVLSFALNAGTTGLIGARELGLMKKDAILVNVSRGDAINQKALYEHLKANPEFYACIDAWWVEPFGGGSFSVDFPFFDLPNVIGSPHSSAHTETGRLDGLRHAAENAARVARGELPKNLIQAADRV
jgi:phosphoglycerate dehydrogenase-like enzyme